MLFQLSTLPLVMFLGAIVCTAASRYEDDDGLPALTDPANDYQQIVYDVDNGVNASFACDTAGIQNFWNDGARAHLRKLPYENNCSGGHAVSRYLSSLQQDKIRNINISRFDSNTGLLTVTYFEYKTSNAPWRPNPDKCSGTKTLWNDGGTNLGQRLKDLNVSITSAFPLQNWTTYSDFLYPKSEVEQQCKASLAAGVCRSGSFVVSSFRVRSTDNLCIKVVMGTDKKTGKDYCSSCYPTQVSAVLGLQC